MLNFCGGTFNNIIKMCEKKLFKILSLFKTIHNRALYIGCLNGFPMTTSLSLR